MGRETLCLLVLCLAPAWVETRFPRCGVSLDTCYYNRAGAKFGDAVFGATNATLLCDADKWRACETCYTEPVYYLEITYPDDLRGLRLVLMDNAFAPDVGTGHVGEGDEINGVEKDIVAVGNGPITAEDGSRRGCGQEDFAERNFSGKITLVGRGGCRFFFKMHNVAAAGGSAMFLIDNQVKNKVRNQMVVMRGTHSWQPIPSGSVSRSGGSFLMSHLDNGRPLRGFIKISCAHSYPVTVGEITPERCGIAAATLSPTDCLHMTSPSSRICVKDCDTIGGSTSSTSSSICLQKNALLPVKEANFIPNGTTLPVSYMSAHGCNVSDFAAHRGKVVVTHHTTTCLLYESVLMAQQAGVIGYIYLTADTSLSGLEGPSHLVNIPVYSAGSVGDVAEGLWLFVDGGELLPPLQVANVEPADVMEPTETLHAVGSDVSHAPYFFLLVGGVSIVFCGVCVSGGTMRRYHYPRRQRYVTRHTIPLRVVSLIILVIVTLVTTGTTFTLAVFAGNEAAESAFESGGNAVEVTFLNAVENLKVVNENWRKGIISLAVELASKWFAEGEKAGRVVSRMFSQHDGKTWASFKSLWPNLIANCQTHEWRFAVRTLNGFYMDWAMINDERQPPPISETNNGFLHDFAYHTWNSLSQSPNLPPHTVNPRGWYDPFESYGNGFTGDTFDVLANFSRQDDAAIWLFSPYSYYFSYAADPTLQQAEHPTTLLIPIFDTSGGFTGSLELRRSIKDLSSTIRTALATTSGTENVTLVITLPDGVVLSTNMVAEVVVDRFPKAVYLPGYLSLDMDSIHEVEVNSLAQHIRENSTMRTTGVFDQSSYSTALYGYGVFEVVWEEGGPVDGSGNNYKMEVSGGGGFGYFTGSTVLSVYVNLTVDTPRVARTGVGEDGRWVSSTAAYNKTRREADGAEIVLNKNREEWQPVLREPVTTYQFSVEVKIRPDEPSPPNATLFTDSPHGAGTVTWHVSGDLHLGITTYGCTTPPLPNNTFPIGSWTHAVATIDRVFTNTCRVYLNGTLYAEGQISFISSASSKAEPYQVGKGFIGKIEVVTVYNRSLLAEEVSVLAGGGGFARYVPSKRWVYNYDSVRVGSSDGEGLDLGVWVLLPEEDVLRDIEANDRATRRDLASLDKANRDFLAKKQTETLLIAFGLMSLCAILLLFLNSWMTEPFSQFSRQLFLLSTLVVEEEPPGATSSITELAVMQSAMETLLEHIKEYKAFMPQVLLAHIVEEKLSIMSDVGEVSSSQSTAESMGRDECAVTASPKYQRGVMENKACSFVVINIKKFHEKMSAAHGLGVHLSILTTALDSCRKSRGILDSFSGDRFTCTFNAGTFCPTHVNRSLEVANLFLEQHHHDTVSMSACGGRVLIGPLGVASMRRFSCIGLPLTCAYAFERYARHHGHTCIVEHSHFQGQTGFSHYVVDVLMFRSVSYVVSVYCGIIEAQDSQEWMYAVSASENPYVRYNEWLLAVLRGDDEEAAHLYKWVEPEQLESLPRQIDGDNFTPTELLYV